MALLAEGECFMKGVRKSMTHTQSTVGAFSAASDSSLCACI